MTELTCQQCQEVATELALDVLPRHERAAALAHDIPVPPGSTAPPA